MNTRPVSLSQLALSLALVGGCGDINVNDFAVNLETSDTITSETVADTPPSSICTSDDDCPSEACRTGTCNLSTGACSFGINADTCFIDGACYLAGQEEPLNRCSLCVPAFSRTGFVNKQCPPAASCDPATGVCVSAASDVLEDTARPEVGADAGPDGSSDDGPDQANDALDTSDDGDDAADTSDAAGDAADTSDDADDVGDDLPPTDGGPDVGGCTGDDDCAALASACIAGTCDLATGNCEALALSGKDCDDSDACTLIDTCDSAGACVGVGDPCIAVTNTCTAMATCSPNSDGTWVCDYSASDGSGCADDDGCTQNETCSGGICAGGTVIACSATDGSDCGGTCVSASPSSSSCDFTLSNGLGCDDNDACTSGEQCDEGACSCDVATGCQPTTDSACADGTLCTEDTCEPAQGCVHTPNIGLGCEDGDPCTVGDACDASGSCSSGANVCGGDCGNGECGCAASYQAAVGESCTIDLSMCSNSQKASAWQGYDTLEGSIIEGCYLSTCDLMCAATAVSQSWPVITEPSWWCGEVRLSCYEDPSTCPVDCP